MSMGTLTMVAESVNGTLVGPDRCFDSVSTDTRTLRRGQLFFALQGERFDASTFVEEAARRGAAGAVVGQRQESSLPQVQVADTRGALGALAKSWRARFPVSVIAVTGSNGKTTVKEMIAGIMRVHVRDESELLVTSGNLNNEIGLPLTLLQLRAAHRYAVLEMGASHLGEIAYLADIAAPGIGVVTNAGIAHLEGFGSRANVAAGKGELFESLSGDGVAVINRDDEFFPTWRDLCGPTALRTFGLSESADFHAHDIGEFVNEAGGELDFELRSPLGAVSVSLPMVGRHNVHNALAAAAATTAAGATLKAVQQGLATVSNVAGRMRSVVTAKGMTIFDDSYNANPGSVRAAIDFLSARDAEQWLALGDMAELGRDSAELHNAAGRYAKQAGIARMFCIGEQARVAADAFGDGAETFANIDAMAEAIRADEAADVVLLVKGSRCMGLERLVTALQQAGSR